MPGDDLWALLCWESAADILVWCPYLLCLIGSAEFFMPCADAAAAIENRREATQESYEVNDKNKKNELIGMMLWLQGK